MDTENGNATLLPITAEASSQTSLKLSFNSSGIQANSNLVVFVRERFAPEQQPSTTHRVNLRYGFASYSTSRNVSQTVPSTLAQACPDFIFDQQTTPTRDEQQPGANFDMRSRLRACADDSGSSFCDGITLELDVDAIGSSIDISIDSAEHQGASYEISPVRLHVNFDSAFVKNDVTSQTSITPLFEETSTVGTSWVSSDAFLERPRCAQEFLYVAEINI